MNYLNAASKICCCICALLLFGCSTSVKVTDEGEGPAPGSVVNGIPFRTTERYQVKLYRLLGDQYVLLDSSVKDQPMVMLANQERLYVLHLEGSVLSDSTVKVKVNLDNTLSFVNVDSTSKGQETLTELGKSIKSVTDAKAQVKATSDKDAADAIKATETGVSTAEATRLDAMDAKRDADLALLELQGLTDSATAIDRTKAEAKLARARVVANQKARLAGLTLPFPGA